MNQTTYASVDGEATTTDEFVETIPVGYRQGYLEAVKVDPALAMGYVTHTMTGDPILEKALDSLEGLKPALAQEYIRRGMEQEAEFSEAPEELQNFFQHLDREGGFEFDPQRAAPGIRAFHKSSDLFYAAMALDALLTGFTELLSRSFAITGRTAGNLRRLQQNARHVAEVTLPGGMARHGDGWKLSIRIRIIHAQVRRLLLASDEWDVPYEGLPLHMSHMGLGATGFSAMAFGGVEKLGVRLTEEERDGYMHIWCYVAWLMGVPDDILYHSEKEALHFRKMAKLVEGDELGEAAAAVAQGVDQRYENPRSAGADRMTQGAGAAANIHFAARQVEIAHCGHGNAGKGFVDLEQIHFAGLPAGPRKALGHRRAGSGGEPFRRLRVAGVSNQARQRLDPEIISPSRAQHKHCGGAVGDRGTGGGGYRSVGRERRAH